MYINISVQFSSVVSDSLRPHESQHARPPCPSPTPGVHSDTRPLSHWCHPAISSSVVPFSSCPQSLPASESFPMSQLFAWGGKSTGVSASASVLPMNIQDWFPLWLTGWISLQSKGLSRVFSNTTAQMHQFFSAQPSSQSNSHIHTCLVGHLHLISTLLNFLFSNSFYLWSTSNSSSFRGPEIPMMISVVLTWSFSRYLSMPKTLGGLTIIFLTVTRGSQIWLHITP